VATTAPLLGKRQLIQVKVCFEEKETLSWEDELSNNQIYSDNKISKIDHFGQFGLLFSFN